MHSFTLDRLRKFHHKYYMKHMHQYVFATLLLSFCITAETTRQKNTPPKIAPQSHSVVLYIDPRGKQVSDLFLGARKIPTAQYEEIRRYRSSSTNTRSCPLKPSTANMLETLLSKIGLFGVVHAYQCAPCSCGPGSCAYGHSVNNGGPACGESCGGGNQPDSSPTGLSGPGTCYGARACPGANCCWCGPSECSE